MEFDFGTDVQLKSDNELIDIYINPSFYQQDMVDAVTTEIQQRKLPIEALNKIKTEKDRASVTNLALGKQGNTLYIVICYCLVLLGGIPGIIAGYIYYFSKQKGSDGQQYYVYNESTRKLGLGMLIIGSIVFFYAIMTRLA